MATRVIGAAVLLAGLCVTGCARGSASSGATAKDADAFLTIVNSTMLTLGTAQGQAGWVQQTYITDDTEAISARATQAYIDTIAKFAKEATK